MDFSGDLDAGPTQLNTSTTGHGVRIGQDKLSVRYLADVRGFSDVGAVVANRPVPRSGRIYYYEMLVVDQGERARIAIGFGGEGFNMECQPGCEQNSYGYHGDDGCKFADGEGEAYGPRFGSGDVVGAGIHHGHKEIFFTKNGMKLRTAFSDVSGGVLFPIVGLHRACCEVAMPAVRLPIKRERLPTLCGSCLHTKRPSGKRLRTETGS